MRKNRLLSLVALILAAIMIFTSCDSPDDSKHEKPDGPNGPDNSPEIFERKDEAAAWAQYLEYEAPEGTAVLSATKFLEDLEPGSYEIKENIIIVNDLVTTEKDGYSVSTKTEKWYSKTTGELVKTFTSTAPSVSSGAIPTDFDVNSLVVYNSEFNPFLTGNTDFIGVLTTTLSLKTVEDGEPEPDPTVFESYDIKREYSYYYSDGTLFLTGLTEMLSPRAVTLGTGAYEAGYYLIDCEENSKTYLINNEGKIFRTFDYQREYDVPVYDAQSLNWDGAGYAYFEVGNYKYVVTESKAQLMPLGELALVLVPGIHIMVTDAEDKAVASYESNCYGIAGYAVLSNGNIYICEYKLLSKDAAEYDVLSGEEKLNITHKIISVANGSVTELDRDYTVSKVFNANTKKINSFLNLVTLGIENPENRECLLDTATVKDGFILTEIQKYADGKLSTNSSFAVLNENLEIVAELPKIVENQFSYPAYANAAELLVASRTANNRIIYYSVDASSGIVSLAPHLNRRNSIEKINNGYFYDNKMYDINWNLVHDFEEDDSVNVYTADFRVVNGVLLYFVNDYSSNEKLKRAEITKSIYDGKDNYSYSTFDFLSNVTFFGEDYIKTVSYDGSNYHDNYYNVNANNLIYESHGYDYIHSEALDLDIRYEVNREIIDIVPHRDGYLATVKRTYTQDSNIDDETGLEYSFAKFDFYIIK